MALTLEQLLLQENVSLGSQDDLGDTLAQATMEVVGLLPRSCLWEAAAEETVPAGGLSVGTRFMIPGSVHVDGHKAVPINPMELTDWSESRSRAFVRRSRYGYYVLNTNLIVVELSVGAIAGKVFTITMPDTVAKTATTIANFPSTRFPKLVALWTAIILKEIDAINIRIDDLPAVTALTAGTLPTVPAAPAFTYSAASAGSITPTTVADPGAPTEPTAPVEPTVPAKPTVPTAPSAAQTIGPLPSDPAYTKVGPLAIPDDQATPTSSDWSAYMEKESTAILDRILQHFQAVTSEFLANVQDEFNEADLERQVWLKQADELFEEARLAHEFDQQKFRTEVESFGGEGGYEVQAFNTVFSNRINEYAQRASFESEIHRQALQKNVEQARTTLQEQIAGAKNSTDVNVANAAQDLEQQVREYAAELERYAAELQAYRFEGERERGRAQGQIEIVIADLRNMRIELNELRGRFVNAFRSYVRTRRHGVSHQFMLHSV